MIVIKRDGKKENFKSYKIEDAIKRAFESVGQPYDKVVYSNIISIIKRKDIWTTEEIQDIVERELFNSRYFEVMRSFMVYRYTRKPRREHTLKDDTSYIDCTQTVEEYISGKDWRVNANSNMGYSHAGLINYIAGKVIANYWLDKIYSKEASYAHRNGDIHIHDLDNLSGYCAGWSLRQLLNEGFNGVRGRVQSKPPKHFREALGQMANFLGVLQSEWAGAQSFSSFDTYLSPYVFKDKLSYSEVKKAIRSFVYNLNVPSRWGQSPFTNITLDWTVPQDIAENWPTVSDRHLFEDIEDQDLLEEAKSRGVSKLTELRYKHFQKEMNMINRAFYEIMNEGDMAGQPFTFPIPTVNITEDFDWEGENTDILFENTAKLGTSYFQNFVGSQYTKDEDGNVIRNLDAFQPYMVRSMCCRLQLDLRELLKRGNGLFGSAEMTGSIGVVTLNMARLGYKFKKDRKGLLKELDRLLNIAKDVLERKRRFIQDMYEKDLYPYTKRYLSSFKNHFSTIGVNGINEMIRNFTDDDYDITDKRGIEFAKEILDFIRERIVRFQEETLNLYNLEATPAEGAAYRFAKEDKKRFPDIITAGEGENIYYTNSSQVPVNFSDDPFEILKLQDDLQCKYTGGTVLHIYLKEGLQDKNACKLFLKRIITNFRLPYVTLTPMITICPKHGRLDKNYEYCPKCDEELLNKYYAEVI